MPARHGRDRPLPCWRSSSSIARASVPTLLLRLHRERLQRGWRGFGHAVSTAVSVCLFFRISICPRVTRSSPFFVKVEYNTEKADVPAAHKNALKRPAGSLRSHGQYPKLSRPPEAATSKTTSPARPFVEFVIPLFRVSLEVHAAASPSGVSSAGAGRQKGAPASGAGPKRWSCGAGVWTPLRQTLQQCPALTDERFDVHGALGAVTRSGKQQGEGNVQVLKFLESPETLQNVELSAREQILISSAPSSQQTRAGFRGFVCWRSEESVCVRPRSTVSFLAPPLPVTLDTLEFCIIFFFKMVVCFLLFLQVLWKKCKKVEVFKNVPRKKGGFVIILIYYCVPIVNTKHSYFASQGLTLYCCYI